jgi:hypothetical protein
MVDILGLETALRAATTIIKIVFVFVADLRHLGEGPDLELALLEVIIAGPGVSPELPRDSVAVRLNVTPHADCCTLSYVRGSFLIKKNRAPPPKNSGPCFEQKAEATPPLGFSPFGKLPFTFCNDEPSL